MRVVRDFDEVYATEPDPWGIGGADSDRYELYKRCVLEHAHTRGRVLDVGCGYGAFLARLRDEFAELHGVELASQAVRGGRERFPFIQFREGSADRLDDAFAEGVEPFDCIVYSDVINYLDERGKNGSLRWIAEHLQAEGLGFVAAWSPGGRYLNSTELRRVIARHLVIEREEVLDSGHALFLARRRRRFVALTVDYETWQPIPEGRQIDWNTDLFRPTGALLEAADRCGARITLMAELGEYLWLCEYEPEVAQRMQQQWVEAVAAGHDVQLHLHPNWLPELGARRAGEHWVWDWSRALADDFPGDLGALIARCKRALEVPLREIDKGYAATCFRAGGYEAQPFERLSAALRANDVRCDTSVYPGDRRDDRHHDYSLAQAPNRPWYASRFDPQLVAPPAERGLIELPIFTYAQGQRWTFDGDEGARFVDRWPEYTPGDLVVSSSTYRRRERLRRALKHSLGRFPQVARWAPRPTARFAAAVPARDGFGHDYCVLVGHSKADLDVRSIERGFVELIQRGAKLVTLADMLGSAERDLAVLDSIEQSCPQPVVDAVSQRLEAATPLTCERLLELAPRTSARWRAYPWMDASAATAPTDHARYDCVWADRVLERAADPQRLLASAFAALVDGGVLMCAVHSDARAPREPCLEHQFRTEPRDLQRRLIAAGFSGIDIHELDLLRTAGRAHPPCDDRVMLVRAWKRSRPQSAVDRIDEITKWCYSRLDPRAPSTAEDALGILAGGHAWCAGAAVVLGTALQREGIDVRWITMLAENHPRGRGPKGIESHEIVGIRLPDGANHLIDPSSAVRFDASIEELLADPTRADTPRDEDVRYRSRRYDLYSTAFWYSRVRRVSIRSHINEPHRYRAADGLRPFSRAARRAWVASPMLVRAARGAWHYRVLPLTRQASTLLRSED